MQATKKGKERQNWQLKKATRIRILLYNPLKQVIRSIKHEPTSPLALTNPGKRKLTVQERGKNKDINIYLPKHLNNKQQHLILQNAPVPKKTPHRLQTASNQPQAFTSTSDKAAAAGQRQAKSHTQRNCLLGLTIMKNLFRNFATGHSCPGSHIILIRPTEN